MGKIVWLASYPKSGNTWVRAFLHNLLRNPEDTYDLNKMSDYTMGDSSGEQYQKFLRKPIKEMTDEDIQPLRHKVQKSLTGLTADNVFVKTHNAMIEYLGWPMHAMEHTAGAIYIVRNPLDMIVSHADHYGRTIDETIELTSLQLCRVSGGKRFIFELHGSWSRHVESWTERPSPGLHIMRYEDMRLRPVEAFAGLVQFLRLPADQDRLRRAIELSSFEALRKKEDEGGFVERSDKSKRFFRQGKAGAWRDVLTPAQVEAVVAVHGPQMRRFGYWPAKGWSMEPRTAGVSAQ